MSSNFRGCINMKLFNDLGIKWKIQIAFLAVSLIIMSAFSYFYYSYAVKSELGNMDNKLEFATKYFNEIINESFVDGVINHNEIDVNLSRQKSMQLTTFVTELEIPYIYAIFIDKDGKLKYITSNLSEQEIRDESAHYTATPYDEPETEKFIRQVLSTNSQVTEEYTSKTGDFRTLYVPKKTLAGNRYVLASDVNLSDVKKLEERIIMTVAIIFAIAIIFINIVAYFLGRLITAPILEMVKVFEQLGSGNADLTYQIPVQFNDESGQMARNFNSFITTLRDMVDSIKTNTNELNTGLVEINGLMNNLLQDAQGQSDRASASAATIEELTTSMGSISTSTDTTTKAVENVNELTSKSSTSVQLLSSEVADITTSAQDLSELIHNLEVKSLDISKIVNVIHGIADQTNLLALNASIEAARAGEHGRGFAVVAEEVRNLAGKTAEATLNISKTIKDISNQILSATKKMDETNHKVENGVKLAGTVLNQIGDIQSDMKAVFDNVQVINLATKEQAVATEDMARSAEEVSNSSIRSQKTVEKTEETVSNLQDKANKLNELVAQFNT